MSPDLPQTGALFDPEIPDLVMSPIIEVCIALTALWSTAASRYTTHGSDFQPDHILRVSEQVFSVACVTRPSTLVNGQSSSRFHHSRPESSSWIINRNLTGPSHLPEGRPTHLGESIQ